MPTVSVITPTIRPEGLSIVQKALDSQTFKDFEWLIGAKGPNLRASEKYPIHWISDNFEGGFWTLNRIYNQLFKKAKGEIVVTWQDFIYARPDALQRFVDTIKDTSGGIISGVGDQYERVGKYGKPEVKIWNDPRKDSSGELYECPAKDVEWNFAAFPKEKIFAVGGMDEELDFFGYGGDQYQVGERFEAMGYKSYLDQSNESFTVRHDRSKHGGQENWNKNHILLNGKYAIRKQQLIKDGKWPVLDYL